MAELIAGTCYVKVDGQVLLLKGSMTATASNVSREAIVANGRVCGHKEVPVVPTISGQFVADRSRHDSCRRIRKRLDLHARRCFRHRLNRGLW